MNFKRASLLVGGAVSALVLALANATAASATTDGHAWNWSPSVNECLTAENPQSMFVIMDTCGTGLSENQDWYAFYDSTYGYDTIQDGWGHCLGVSGDSPYEGANITTYSCNSNKDQRWLPLPNSATGYYEWQTQGSKMCLSIANGSLSSGAQAIQWPCHNTADQLWGGSLQL